MDVVMALQSFKAILDGVKAVSDTRDETRRNEAVIQLTREVIDLQSKMISSLQEQAKLTEKVRALETELAKLKSSGGDLQRYELKDVGGGGVVYMLKPEARGTEPPHWLCPNCYGNGKKSVFQFSAKLSGMGNVYRCSGCKAHMTTRATPAWIGDARPIADDRETCRFCRIGKLDLVDSKPDPIFGDVGLKLETLKCNNAACSKTDERQHDPSERR